MSDWRPTFPWTASVLDFLWPAGPARRKRWLKIVGIGVALVVLHAGLTAVMAARASRVAERFVEQWGPLDPTAHRPSAVEDEDNQARAVRAAAELLVLRGSSRKLHEDYASGKEGELGAADLEAIRKVVADNAITTQLLDLAVARVGSNWDLHYERGVSIDVPPLMRIMQLAKLNVAAGRLALEDGRVDEALAAVRRGTALGASLDQEPILIVQLVRQAVARLNAGLARRIMSVAEPTPEALGILAAAFPEASARLRMQRAMIVETGAIAGILEGNPGDGASWSRNPRLANLIATGLVRVLARPYLLNEKRLWLSLMTARINELDAARHARASVEPRPVVRWWNFVVQVAGFEDTALVDRADLAESRDLIGRTAIAIERHRLAVGKPPDARGARFARGVRIAGRPLDRPRVSLRNRRHRLAAPE